MPRQRRVPLVGSKQLHPVQISPEIRTLEAHRTKAAAHRAYAPAIAADKRAFGEANREYRAQARSVKGATHMVEGALAQALAGLKGSGLSGRYLRQTQNEFTSRQADAASAIPALLAGAQEERGKALREASTQLTQDQASMHQSAAESFNQRLKELRGAGSSALASEANKEVYSPEKLQNASIALQDSLSNWAKNVTVEVDGKAVPIQSLNPLTSIENWRALAQGMTKQYDGFDLRDAMAVIRKYLEKRRKQAPGPYRSQSSNSAIRSKPETRVIPPPAG